MRPDRARVVIVGGGIASASIAYHLAQRGWRDVAVLEQGALVSGTTSHAPGLVGQLRSSVSLTRMLMESVSLYRQLSVDGTPGYHEVGGLRLASSRARLAELERQAAFARGVGLEAHLLGPGEAAELFPLMSLEGVEGALYLPSDGSAQAPILARALIREAEAQGVTFHSHTPVQAIELDSGRVRAVATPAGRIETETLVVAAGIWSPLVARRAGIELPLMPMQHQYVVTAPLPELADRTVPNLRDPDKLVYLRQAEQGLIVGGYERDPRPFPADGIPTGPDPTVRGFDAAHFATLSRAAAERVPCLAAVELSRQVNGLESFTPDGEFLLGPSAQVPGCWFACGFCAHGVAGSGGLGKAIAGWITSGDPGLDLRAMSPDRPGAAGLDAAALQQHVCDVYGTYYDLRP
jgi:glycine/D-amino acid oxidase-like deaminating enzyme